MRYFKSWPVPLFLAFLFLFSCEEEDLCDTQDYALPEISMLVPEDGMIIVPEDWQPPVISLHLKADAGLNTLTLLDPWGSTMPIKAFIQGEIEEDYSFQLSYPYEGENTFVLYDLCNRRAEVKATVIFE